MKNMKNMMQKRSMMQKKSTLQKGNMLQKKWVAVLLVGVLMLSSFPVTGSHIASADEVPETRNAKAWPFATDSPFNTPIGSDAVYVDAEIVVPNNLNFDEDYYLFETQQGDTWRTLLFPGWPKYTDNRTFRAGHIQVPDDMIVNDSTPPQTPNNITTILQPDGRTLIQIQPGARVNEGGNVWGYRATETDLYGAGLYGSHFGSGMSGLGVALKPGELTNDEPIRHTLGLEFAGHLHYYYDQEGGGYRWPADRSDWVAPLAYGGTNPALVNGSLLAIKPDVNLASLNLETKSGEKLFQALQDFGGYIVDDSGVDTTQIVGYKGINEEINTYYGYNYWDGNTPLLRDIKKLVDLLHVVDNNGPDSIGGGGTPRVALAPDFDAPAPTPAVALDATGWTATASATAAGHPASNAIDGDEDTTWRSGKIPDNGDTFTVDLGQTTEFNRFYMTTEKNNRDDWAWNYEVRVSQNGSDWTYVASGTAAPITQMTFPVQEARYIQIFVNGHHPDRTNWWSIDEFRLYHVEEVEGPVDDTIDPYVPPVDPNAAPSHFKNVALNKPATASSDPWNTASNANDGDSATTWVPANGNTGYTWTVDLERAYDLAQIRINWENARNYQYVVAVSEDNVSWTQVVDNSGTTSTDQERIDDFMAYGKQYVRITVTGLPNDSWSVIREVEVLGAENLAIGKTASASSDPWSTAAHAIDGDVTTGWIPANGNVGHAWKLDLGAAYELQASDLLWEFTGAYQYIIETSPDDVNWTTVIDRSDNTVSSQRFQDSFNVAGMRYVRVTATGLPAGFWSVIKEFNLYGEQNVAIGKPASASSDPWNTAALANDGDTSSKWVAADDGLGYWWKVDLEAEYDLTEVQVNWEYGGNYQYRIEVSDDDSTWSELVDQTAYTGSQQIRSHAVAQPQVRYVRITVTGMQSGLWSSIREFKVYGTPTVPPAP